MKTEREKMLAGELYDSSDPQLVADRLRARELCFRYNGLPPAAPDAERAALLAELFGRPTDAIITPPFHCDYGRHIVLGAKVYFNFNCIVLDVAKVTIGHHVLLGPGVQVLTASHPLKFEQRRDGRECGKPIAIGDGVWIGGGAILCPGVAIGARTVIGAGSVVIKDVPADVFAAGNPCRVIRRLDSPGGLDDSPGRSPRRI